MLLRNTELLLSDPVTFLVLLAVVAVTLVIAISGHEFAHALAANRLGDMTATRMGRLTLNPLAHLDPAGSVMVLVAGFGWGRPVPVDPRRLRGGRGGMALVALAGPLSNVLMALGFAALLHGPLTPSFTLGPELRALDPLAWANVIASYGVLLNLVLAAFNLLPIAPLDGSGILTGIAPRALLPAIAKLQVIGPLVLVVLLLSSFVVGQSVFGTLFTPIYAVADWLIYG